MSKRVRQEHEIIIRRMLEATGNEDREHRENTEGDTFETFHECARSDVMLYTAYGERLSALHRYPGSASASSNDTM